MLAILRRNIIALILGVIGLCLILAGIASATIWKPSPTVAATTTVQKLGVTRPGVLELIAKDVHIQASTSKGAVAIMVGRSRDVNAWVGQSGYTEINGLKTFTALDTKEVKGKNVDLPDPTNSDMWVQQEAKNGKAQMKWQNKEGSWSALIYSPEAPAKVQLTWHRTVTTPWLWPLVGAGIVFLLLAALAAVLALRSFRKRSGTGKNEPKTDTVSINVGSRKIEAPGRKALRQARERGESEIVVDGVSFPTGLIPVVSKKEDSAEEDAAETQAQDQADQKEEADSLESQLKEAEQPELTPEAEEAEPVATPEAETKDNEATAEGHNPEEELAVPVVELPKKSGSSRIDLSKFNFKKNKKEQ